MRGEERRGEEREKYNVLPTDATPRPNRKGLRSLFIISRKLRIAKPALRSKDVRILKVDRAPVSRVGAVLHICLA